MIKVIATIVAGLMMGGLCTFAAEGVNIDVTGGGGKRITAFDRVGERKIGGYFDTEYHMMRNGDREFKAHRFILNMSCQVHERVLVNTEIEFEYGGKLKSGDSGTTKGELKLEQAWADFSLDDRNYFRAGIVLIPFGIVNILHDSDVRDTTQRPLYATYIVPSTWMDTGVGAHGTFDTAGIEVNYEAYIVNGLDGTDFTKGIRNLRPNFKDDPNNKPALAARLGVSPLMELEIGTSTYLGNYDANKNGITMIGFDVFWKKGPFELVGEFAKLDIDPASGTTVSNMNGYYFESRYHFFPSFLKKTVIARGFSHPTFTLFARYGSVDIDENSVGSSDKSRITLGMNYRPVETVVIKLEGQLGRENGNSIQSESGIISSVAIGF